jgi:hypothetical protein
MSTKKCTRCKIEKPLNDFFSDKRSPDGKICYCKNCHKEMTIERRQKKIDLGLRPPVKYRPVVTQDIKDKIVAYYLDGIGSHRISKLVGLSKRTVLLVLASQNIDMRHEKYRKYKFKNENYFDQIDDVEKAYFLGLLWADGCNYRKDNYAYQIHVNLQEKDGYIIRELAKKIYGNDDIVKLIDKNAYNKCDEHNRQKQAGLRIPSKHISDKLLSYGMEPRKSFILDLPKEVNFNEDLWRAFIRGYYDGDGGISFNTNSKNYTIGIISSPIFCQKIQEIILKYSNIKINIDLMKDRYSSPMNTLKIHGNNKSEEFLNWLYKDSTIHLSRKYEKYLLLKELVKTNKAKLDTNPLPSSV